MISRFQKFQTDSHAEENTKDKHGGQNTTQNKEKINFDSTAMSWCQCFLPETMSWKKVSICVVLAQSKSPKIIAMY